MPQFLLTIYDQIDSGQLIDQKLYLINASFQEALTDLPKRSLPNLDKNIVEWMQFSTEKGMPGLSGFKLSYNCQWPVAFVIDKVTVERKYNRVLRLLL